MLRQMTTETATDMVKTFCWSIELRWKTCKRLWHITFWFKINHPQQRQASKYNEPISRNKQEKQLRGTAGSQACRYEVKHEETLGDLKQKTSGARRRKSFKSYTIFETFQLTGRRHISKPWPFCWSEAPDNTCKMQLAMCTFWYTLRIRDCKTSDLLHLQSL